MVGAGDAISVFSARLNVCSGWQMLMVSSGWLGPETMTNPQSMGALANRTGRWP